MSLWLSSILLCFHDLGLQVQLPAWWSPNHYSSPCASGVLAQARGGVAYCLHSVPLTLALAPRHMSLFTLTFVPDSFSQSLLHCYSVCVPVLVSNWESLGIEGGLAPSYALPCTNAEILRAKKGHKK